MDKVQEINSVMKQLVEDLQIQPYGLDVSIERFDAESSIWTVRMKKHFISISAQEINEKDSIKGHDLDLYSALKELFLEKFQWLTWETI